MAVPLPVWAQNNSYFFGFNTQRIVDEWDFSKNNLDGYSLEDPGISFTDKIHWVCEAHGHEWMDSIDSRRIGNDCPYCQGIKILVGFNDLGSLKGIDSTLQEWNHAKNNGLTPQDVLFNSAQSVHWKCLDYGHEWTATVRSRTGKTKQGCTICSGRKVLKGFNDVASMADCIDIVAEWHPTKNGKLTPDNTPFNYIRKIWFKCSLNDRHEWNASLANRRDGRGCLICAADKNRADFLEAFTMQSELFFVPATLHVMPYLASDRTKAKGNIDIDVDGYNDEMKLVIMFDDEFSHGASNPNRVSAVSENEALTCDYEETGDLLRSGYKVIRIREKALEGSLSPLYIDWIKHSTKDNYLELSYKSSGEKEGNISKIVAHAMTKKATWFI